MELHWDAAADLEDLIYECKEVYHLRTTPEGVVFSSLSQGQWRICPVLP